jgi:hypothetical protein
MDGNTRSVALALIVIILACIAIFIGMDAADFMGQLRSR